MPNHIRTQQGRANLHQEIEGMRGAMGSLKGNPVMGHGWRHPLHRAGGEKTEGYTDGVKTVLRIKNVAPFKRVKKLVGKLHYAAIGILTWKALSGPINQLMVGKPTMINNISLDTMPGGQGGTQRLEAAHLRSIERAHACERTCAGGHRLQGYTQHIW